MARRRRHRAACGGRRRRDGDLPVLWRARRERQALAAGGHDAGAGEERAPQGGGSGRRQARRRRHPVLGPWRLSLKSDAGGAVPARRRLSRDPSRLRALPLRTRHLQSRPSRNDGFRAACAHSRAGAWPQSASESAGRAASLPVRAASARAMRLEAGRAARHLVRLGEEARRDRMHGGPGASLGLLHPRRASARRQAARNSDKKSSTGKAINRSSRMSWSAWHERRGDRDASRPLSNRAGVRALWRRHRP